MWNLPKTKIGFAGLYEYGVKHPILPKQIKKFRQSFRIGDEIEIPVPTGESDFRPNYISRCTVKEIYPHYVVVSHGGLWSEAINYVDFMTNNPSASVVIASKELSDEYYRLLDEYWEVSDLIYAGHTDLMERYDSLDKRLKEIEPLILQSERFSGNKTSTKLYGGEVWKALADKCKEELGAC